MSTQRRRLSVDLPEHGSVARGVCRVEDGLLADVVEHTKIFKDGNDARFTEDGEHFEALSGDTPVSMNCWGFGAGMLEELARRFPAWLDENLPKNPLKCEYFLPTVVNGVIRDGAGSVRVLPCRESWYGITYREDLESVVRHLAALREKGLYPEKLLD